MTTLKVEELTPTVLERGENTTTTLDKEPSREAEAIQAAVVAQHLAERPELERFADLAKKLLGVPKSEIDEQRRKDQA